MTNINPKLAAAITTIAMLAPAAGAQAASSETQNAARHFAVSASQRFDAANHYRWFNHYRRFNATVEPDFHRG